MPSPIFDLADEYVERYAEFFPNGAAELGVRTSVDRLSDYSPESHSQVVAYDPDVLARLESFEPATSPDRIAKLYMAERLRASILDDDAGDWMRPLGTWGPLSSIRQTFDHVPKDTPFTSPPLLIH